jgi:uncharacterized protein (DUF983 family)
MNKISLGIVVVCSSVAGVMLGKFVWLPQEVTIGTWVSMGMNIVAVLISLSNIVNHDKGIENALEFVYGLQARALDKNGDSTGDRPCPSSTRSCQ